MVKKHIVVAASSRDDGRVSVEVSFLKDEPKFDIEQTTHVLTSAISLLIKAAHQSGEIKDYTLIKDVIEHLNSDFISNDSFNDMMYNNQNT